MTAIRPTKSDNTSHEAYTHQESRLLCDRVVPLYKKASMLVWGMFNSRHGQKVVWSYDMWFLWGKYDGKVYVHPLPTTLQVFEFCLMFLCRHGQHVVWSYSMLIFSIGIYDKQSLCTSNINNVLGIAGTHHCRSDIN